MNKCKDCIHLPICASRDEKCQYYDTKANICKQFAKKVIKKLEDKAKDLKYWFDDDNLGVVISETGKILAEMEQEVKINECQ